MRTFIFPVGTSIVRGLQRHLGIDAGDPHWRAQVTAGRLAAVGDPAALSAEVAFLSLAGATADDTVVLLATDTREGTIAAAASSYIIESLLHVPVRVQAVRGLGLEDVRAFRAEGLPKFVQQLDAAVDETRREGREPIVAIGSGIKATVPHMAMFAMLRRVKVGYAFERPPAIMWLPALPIGFDWDSIHAAAPLVRRIRTDVAILRTEAVAWLGEHFPVVEGLFEDAGDDTLTLSPFGFLVEHDIEVAESSVVMLSSRARAALQDVPPAARAKLESMLLKVRNPQWRTAHRRQEEGGCDLDVWRRNGDEMVRILGWLGDRHTIYVAELLTDHDAYDRIVAARRRRHYPVVDFQPWRPGDLEPERVWERDEEVVLKQLERRVTTLEHELRTAHEASETARRELHQQANELLASAAASDGARADAELRAARLLEQRDQACAAQQRAEAEVDAWRGLGFWQRLRWAITGRK